MTSAPTAFSPVRRELVDPQLRLAQPEAQLALDTVRGASVLAARARLRFGPGRTCEPLARVLDKAVAQAAHAGLDIESWFVAEGTATAAADIVRVRRLGFGPADWISSPACSVRIVVCASGTPPTAGERTEMPSDSPDVQGSPVLPAGNHEVAGIREALREVIDPDLGVNVVDLGFVRAIDVEGRTATVTMTLTSPACPLTEIIETQVRDRTADLPEIDGIRVEWQWLPSWRPTDISESGRDQLRAIGFAI